ncbi:MAG: DUF4124 domain-containing protein [Rhodanobacter sp.]|nr:MAG: DUF4124 domain-containing protein [Rhodanobacter sp.]
MRKLCFVLVTTVLVGSLSAQTRPTSSVRYKWHDEAGLLHYSDSLSAEAMKQGYDLVNDRGLVIQHVSRQLNPQQRAAADKLAAEQAATRRAEQERADADAQMLSAYPDEKSYRTSQQQVLQGADRQIQTTRLNLRSQEQALANLLSRAAEDERSKNSVPKFLTDGIARQRDVVTGQRNLLKHQQTERAQTVLDQARELSRYRRLKAAQSNPQE